MKNNLFAAMFATFVILPAVAQADSWDGIRKAWGIPQPVEEVVEPAVKVKTVLQYAFKVKVQGIDERCASSPSAGFAPRYSDVPALAQNACVIGEKLAETRLDMMLPAYIKVVPARVATCLQTARYELDSPTLYREINACIARG